MTAEPLVQSVPAQVLHNAIKGLGVTHVLTVPDTHQKSLLASLVQDTDLKFVGARYAFPLSVYYSERDDCKFDLRAVLAASPSSLIPRGVGGADSSSCRQS